MEQPASLAELRETWLSLVRQTRINEANTLYWERLFPLVEKEFLAHNKIEEHYDWLVLPCGLEASYYILLIKAIRPKQVYFLGTEEFVAEFLETIIKNTGLKASEYIFDKISYEGLDITDVYDKIRARLNLFIDKKILMDLTRGKRIMSVGAGIVGAFFGFDLVYIDESWVDDVKRGMPGTEKLVMVRNPFEVFGDLELREARAFLNNHNYGAALALYRRIQQKIVDPRNVEIEAFLSEAYMHWNSFNFKAAVSKLQTAVDKLQQYHIKAKPEILENLIALKVLDTGSQEIIKSEEFNLHVIIDLYCNAMRKSEVGIFEDAISRLYRVLELITQNRLKSHGIETLGSDLTPYESAYKAVTKEIYGIEKNPPMEIGLKDGFILLYIKQDYLLEGCTPNDLKRMFGVIRARDMSIIAHGLQLAGEKVFVNLNTLTKDLIQKICIKQNRNLPLLLHQHTFVKL